MAAAGNTEVSRAKMRTMKSLRLGDTAGMTAGWERP